MFKVVIQASARFDALEAASYIAQDSAERARRWAVGYLELVARIGDYPLAFPLASHLRTIQPVRSAHHHSHTIYFLVYEETETVVVLRVIHSARQTPTNQDLFG